MNDKVRKNKIAKKLDEIKNRIYSPLCGLKVQFAHAKEPVPFGGVKNLTFKDLAAGEKWGDLFDCAWFRFTGIIPNSAKGKHIAAIIDINGEGCVYDAQGVAVRGITNINSRFDRSLGLPGKRVLQLYNSCKGGEKVELLLDGGCNDLFGGYCGGVLKQAEIAVCDDALRELYYDFWVLNDLLDALPEDSARYAEVMFALDSAADILINCSAGEVKKAGVLLETVLNKSGGDCALRFTATGHAHMDLAWLWPIRETKRKAERTFSTLIELLDRYPDYIIGISQPQQYEWLKERQPVLYEKVRQKIGEGRIEPQGAMWVEPDVNLASGESLIRQIMYGKEFFRREFGREINIAHLPDVFGFSGSLPQILKKSGVEYLLTIKISWNKYNKFPYHTFRWVGTDGSEILTHMPPEGTYNSAASPSAVKKAERNYAEKGLCGEAVILYGIGDGGGGPGTEHLERLKREKDLNGLCPVQSGSTADFFGRIEKGRARYPEYCGELYLEKHQGTYTTQAKNKYYNRHMESLLSDCEFLSAAVFVLKGAKYPQEELDNIWREVLLYQFHDILPGSSIKRVYDESLERYAVLEKQVAGLIEKAREKLNLNCSCEAAACVDTGNSGLRAGKNFIENRYLRASFGADGALTGLYDKERDRETISAPSNILRLLNDAGDAWDMSDGYLEQSAGVFTYTGGGSYIEKGRAVFEQNYTYGNSAIKQTIFLASDKPYLEIDCEADWRESFKFLRAEFYPAVKTDAANCGIQFGNIKRPALENNSIEKAQEEVCAHRYVDLSDQEYGVALFNDCKYGHRLKRGGMFLSLLRSPHYPGENADKGTHRFRYALYPHGGRFEDSDVPELAYEFDRPQSRKAGLDFIGLEGAAILETVKKAQDENAVIARFYEPRGKNVAVKLKTAFAYKNAYESTMDEKNIAELENLELRLSPFEIKTIKFTL